MINALSLAIALLRGIAAATPTPLDDVALALISEAIAKLEEVRGTPVTLEQIESLRVEPTWPDA